MEALDQMWAKKEAFDMEKEGRKRGEVGFTCSREKEQLLLEEKKGSILFGQD